MECSESVIGQIKIYAHISSSYKSGCGIRNTHFWKRHSSWFQMQIQFEGSLRVSSVEKSTQWPSSDVFKRRKCSSWDSFLVLAEGNIVQSKTLVNWSIGALYFRIWIIKFSQKAESRCQFQHMQSRCWKTSIDTQLPTETVPDLKISMFKKQHFCKGQMYSHNHRIINSSCTYKIGLYFTFEKSTCKHVQDKDH